MSKQTKMSSERGPLLDTKRLADTLVAGAKAYIDKALSSIVSRLDALEKRQPERGEKGEKGDVGEPGSPGVGVASALIDRDGELVVTLSDGAVKNLGRVTGQDGTPGKDGRDGKDADVELVKRLIADEIASLPKPRDGKDGRDGKDADPEMIRLLVAEAVASIPTPQDGKDGAPGKDGKDADPELIKRLVDDAVASLPPVPEGVDETIQALCGRVDGLEDGLLNAEPVRDIVREFVSELPAPKDGRDGIDGKDADPELVRELVRQAISEIPLPQDGRDGKDGIDGKDADPELIRGMVQEAISKIPAPKDGVDGKNGRDGIDGKDGAPGRDGTDGKDGVGVAGAFINKDGSLVLTTSDGRTHELGVVVGKDGQQGAPGVDGKDGTDGRDGKDGADGFGFDDLSVEYDGARQFSFKFTRGDRVKEFPFTVPVMLDRGVYKVDTAYEAGDVVSFGGSMWIAQEATTEKPGTKSWRLAVKRGQDGRDAVSDAPAKSVEPVRFR